MGAHALAMDSRRHEAVVPSQGHVSPGGGLRHALLDCRRAGGLTAAQAGALVGVGRSAWCGWESGVVPSPANLARIALLLGLSPAEARSLAGQDRVRRPGALGDAGATGLAAARLARGLTATELAVRLHVSLSCVSRWESGERVPDVRARASLATALGVPAAEIDVLLRGRTAAGQAVALPGLRSSREAAGVRQHVLAARLGVDASTLRRWERLGAAPSRYAEVLAATLGRSIHDPPTARTTTQSEARRNIGALTRLRRRRGLPVSVVAARVQVSAATVWAWERGDRRPDWCTARRLAEVLGASARDVFVALGLTPPDVLHRSTWRTEEVPQALRELRRWNGMTQSELAEHLGVGAGTVANWERGRFRPNERSARALRTALPVAIVFETGA